MCALPSLKVLRWQALAVLVVRFALAVAEAPGLGYPSMEASVQLDVPKRGRDPSLKLVWSDEFDGTVLNTSNWQIHPGCDGVHNNNEKECYTSEGNVYLNGRGHLVLQVRKDSKRAAIPYTSGRVTTLGKGTWTYGRFTVAVRVPSGQGFWPAVWMLPVNNTNRAWPISELDIVEVLGKDPAVAYGTAHFGAPWPRNRQKSGHIFAFNRKKRRRSGHSGGQTFADAFHEFSMEWTQSDVRWFINDKQYHRMRTTDRTRFNSNPWAPLSRWPFDQPFYIIMNLAMGGKWPGDPDLSITRGEMLIDYIRVYQ